MRIDGWESQLADYLIAAVTKPFAWGSHDCALWAGAWVKVCTGQDFVSDWARTYSSRAEAREEMRKRGFHSAAAVADRHLPEKPVVMARRGDLVLHPTTGSLGICNGRLSQFPGESGALTIGTLACVRAWAV